jgi:small subunit ribosomal protein S16
LEREGVGGKMAVVLRLKRMGANKKPFYRIVATERSSPRDGRFIEEIGQYDPKKNPALIKVDKERALYWLKNGAQPSVTVRSLLKKQGIRG